MHLSHHPVLLAGVLLLLACRAPEREEQTADEVPSEQTQPANTDESVQAPAVEEGDSDYRARAAATGTYQDCMQKRAGLEKEQADLVARACGNMPDAPKSR